MPAEISGELNAAGMRFALVVSRFNSLVTQELLNGALDTLKRHGADPDEQTVLWAPGGWELPLVAQCAAKKGGVDGLIVLGCVMKGQTANNEYIANEIAKALGQLSLHHGIPVAYGVLTPNSLEQALERAGLKMGNKGAEAAAAAIEMVSLLRKLQ
ncbi:6,7-dimethyl-8-ribityllumazine synthase [Candidatus Poribacteria bacterium]|nr:6,7-dimethyl-8-ribityllumazine synthase [Candidatus Poribacteria bacterium]